MLSFYDIWSFSYESQIIFLEIIYLNNIQKYTIRNKLKW